MEVYYGSENLKQTLEDERKCKGAYGSIQRTIFKRSNALKAAKTLQDLKNTPGKWHGPLTGDRKGQFAVHLDASYRMVFRPLGNPENYTVSGTIVWSKITSVEVIAIVDYHS